MTTMHHERVRNKTPGSNKAGNIYGIFITNIEDLLTQTFTECLLGALYFFPSQQSKKMVLDPRLELIKGDFAQSHTALDSKADVSNSKLKSSWTEQVLYFPESMKH